MGIPGHDKMSSRVVLENDGAAHGKVTDNILLRRSLGKRKSRDHETSRPIPPSRTLPHSEEKPKNRAGLRGRSAIRKRQNPLGRRHFCPNLNKIKRNSLSWHLFPRNAGRSRPRKNQRIILDCVDNCSLSFVALLKKFLCSVTKRRKKKKKMMIERERERERNWTTAK